MVEAQGAARGPVTVAAVDNDRMALLALKGIMPQLLPESRWLWGVETADEAVRRALDPDAQPQVLLVDMSLGDATGVSVCRMIRQRTDRVALLAITAFSTDAYARRAAEAGARGIVSKADIPQLAKALRTVAAGGTFAPPQCAGMFRTADATGTVTGTAAISTAPEETPTLGTEANADANAGSRPKLGAKEAETLHLLSQGLSYDEIASRWGVAASTVRTHAHRAVDKLGAHSLAHAIAIWLSR
ncbi:response regulator transcription factor [Bifidobacterium biavatii]|uniref:Two-component response regulator n=1 Tax=Bifidobacterium biavatii DSM 23969 TaxID=1437608 RepID=A0A087A1J9_9BIFI|nr:response regulator transcription factor [Bifidobacterium biavatii]KFI52649.1 two-component response regulator [Bifidobacterium biavatii DSM 23969]